MGDFNFGENFKSSADRMFALKAQRLARAEKSLPFRISFLDDIAVGIMPTDLIVIGAETGAGKTTLGALIAETAAKHGVRVAYLALEAHNGEIEMRLLFRRISTLCWENNAVGRGEISYAHWINGQCEGVTAPFEDQAREDLQKELRLLKTFYRVSTFGAADLTRLMAAIKNDTDLIVVDHLHFIDNESSDENRGTKAIVKTISDAVREQGTPVIAIAHLRKKDVRSKRLVPHIDDFHGSSDIVKIATKAIVMAPARRVEGQSKYIANTYMRMAKDRTVGELGVTGLLQFDVRSNGYLDGYKLGRLSFDGSKWEQLATAADYPWWAKKADRHEQRV